MKKKEIIEIAKGSLILETVFYGQDIEKTELSLKGELDEKQYFVDSMIIDRTKITYLLDYLKNKPTNQKTFNIKEYKELLNFLDKRFEKIKQRKKFYEKAQEELEFLARNWKQAAKLSWIEYNEFDHDLQWRDDCEAMLNELEGKKDVSKVKEILKNADMKMQNNAPKLLKRFYGYYEDGRWDYYPKSYWWRHLKEFVEELHA